MKPLLIELGCEELPAGVGRPAAEALRDKLVALIRDHRLACGDARVFHAPRRLAVFIDAVAASGEAQVVEKTGPPAKAAFGPDGKPTKAAAGFAKGVGVAPEQLYRVTTDKGEYAAARVELPAVSLAELLAKELPGIVAALPFPKTMVWNDTKFRASRPLRWLVVLHGADIVPVQLAGLTAGRESRGHRYHAAGPAVIADATQYEQALLPVFVIPDADERRRRIADGARQAAPAGGEVALDAKLLDEVADLVEYPFPFRADFDERYLRIPAPVLVGAMRKHQRYFPVHAADKPERLLPCFIGVANGDGGRFDMDAVREGNNRVLRARFDDAEFFFASDTAKPLAEFVPELDRIMYEKTLGSIGDRVRRIDALVAELVKCGDFTATVVRQAHAVARLCKADLATKMVFEFTELQGAIGREYALREGYDRPVCDGLQQHYWPTGPDSEVPREYPAMLVALADKFDAVAGGFATGKEPTGSADPYALRRAALGIIRILLHAYPQGRLRVPVRAVFVAALGLVGEKVKVDAEKTADRIMAFLAGRLENYLRDARRENTPAEIAAVLAAPWRDLDEVAEKLAALGGARQGAEETVAALAAALKRAQNITKGEQDIPAAADAALCREEAERELLRVVQQVAAATRPLLAARDYARVMTALLTVRPALDRFFTEVLVMAPEPELKRNRLALARQTADLFRAVADFSQLG